jgi:hypothetical protein
MRSWVLSRWQHLAAHVNPFEAEELALLRSERERGGHSLGDMPLIVVTRGIADEDGPGGNVVELERRKKEHAEWRRRFLGTAVRSLLSAAAITSRLNSLTL